MWYRGYGKLEFVRVGKPDLYGRLLVSGMGS
jgi:hypothetical protein